MAVEFLSPMRLATYKKEVLGPNWVGKRFSDGSSARGWEFPVVTGVDVDNWNTVWNSEFEDNLELLPVRE